MHKSGLLLENNEHWGGNITFTLQCDATHHPVFDNSPIIAGPILFETLLIYMNMYKVG